MFSDSDFLKITIWDLAVERDNEEEENNENEKIPSQLMFIHQVHCLFY